MKNMKVNINKFIAIALMSSVTLTATSCGKASTVYVVETVTETEDYETKEEPTTQILEIVSEETTAEKPIQPVEETEPIQETITKIQTTSPEITEQPTTQEQLEIYEPSQNINDEGEVVEFFQGISNKADTWVKSDTFENVKDDVTSGLATFILFMSGDSTIGGYTFESLTDEGKEKIKILLVSMDEKLDNKFPGYKEKIGDKWTVVKVFVSTKYNKVKNEVKEYVIENVGEDNYDEFMNNISEGWVDLKGSFSNTFNFLKDNILGWAKEKKNQ